VVLEALVEPPKRVHSENKRSKSSYYYTTEAWYLKLKVTFKLIFYFVSKDKQQYSRNYHNNLNHPKDAADNSKSSFADLLFMEYQWLEFLRQCPILHREEQVVIVVTEAQDKEYPISSNYQLCRFDEDFWISRYELFAFRSFKLEASNILFLQRREGGNILNKLEANFVDRH
jgi:hypothetical protein